MLNGFRIDNTGLIIDFDRTISHGGDETAFSVFSTSPYIPQKLKDARKGLYEYYRPIELNLEMPPEERTQHMIDWYVRAMTLFEEHLTQNHMQGTIHHAIERIHIRDGFKDFLHFLHTNKIPVIIYSAGVSNIIDAILKHHNIPHIGLHGNKLHFDKSGNCIGVANKIPIHNENKVWASIPEKLKGEFNDRTHILLIGDSIGDIMMAPQDRETKNIGFLVSSQKTHEQRFRDTFDYVIESDICDRGFLAEVRRHLEATK